MKAKILRFLDVAVEYLIYGVIFFIPISIVMIGTFAGMAIVFFLLKTILSRDFSAIKSNKVLFLFLLVFFIFMSLSLLNSGPLISKSIKTLLLKWGRYPLLLWAVIGTFRDTRRVIRAVRVILFSATLVGISVFTQKFFGFEFLRGRILDNPYLLSTGPFKTQNALAAYLGCVIPILLSFSLWKWKSIVARVCLPLIMGLLIMSSFWTRCRGGWLGLISGLLFVILTTNYYRLKRWFGVISFSSFVFLIPAITVVLYFLKPDKDANRLLLAHGAWGMIKENPWLGKGVGTFMDYCIHYTNNFGAYYAHNCYLQIWAESGIFSLLSFILFAGYVVLKSIRINLKVPVSLNFFILIGLTGGLLGFLVHSFFEVHLYSFQLSFLFWLVVGLIVALTSKLEQEQLSKP